MRPGSDLRPDPGPESAAALRQAVALHKAGRLEPAIKAYRALLKRWPALPQAHNNLGVALKASGRLQPALKAYRQAIALAPGYAAAHGNLGSGLLLLGQAREALPHFLAASQQEPNNASHRQGLAAALRPMRFTESSPAIETAFLRCFDDPGLEHQILAPAALSLLTLDRAIAWLLADSPSEASAPEPHLDALDALAAHPLALKLLMQTVVPDANVERQLTALRQRCLLEILEDSNAAGLTVPRPLAAALAIQAYLTDYAYPENEAETEQLAAVSSRALADTQAADGISDSLLVTAMYRPLHSLPDTRILDGVTTPKDPALAALWSKLWIQPRAERALAEAMPRLTPIADDISAAVAAQYDEHPYPRWFATQAKVPQPLPRLFAELFPGREIVLPAARPLQVLVAGCGTGKHAIDVATRYAEAEVLAVDLSRSALAVGQQRAQDRALTSLSFGQADILELGALDRRFHLIESVGVLHHLRDPRAGWRVLVELLEAPGLMRLGFYSRQARGAIEQARQWVAEAGFRPNEAGIRAARQALLSLDPGRPERKVAAQLDFYSLSGCRDLLFNVQERSYDLPELATAIDDLGLTFLGFEFADPWIPNAYATRFPKDRSMTDLDTWDRFERDRPDSFQQMYQFWCAKV